MERYYGWKKDKYDYKDYPYKRRLIALPRKFQIEVIPPILDQYNFGACVAFAIGSILAGEAAIDGRSAAFSQWWIYNGARFIDGSLLEDIGAYPRDAFEWILKNGCLQYPYWPYTPEKFDTTAPPSKFFGKARKWPLVGYYRINGGEEPICDVIASGHYVALGVPWFNTWNNPNSTGRLAELTGKEWMSGGHETFLHGYDMDEGYFIGNNSWGVEWGANGKFYMPFQAFEYFRYYGGYDAHFLDVNWNETRKNGNVKQNFWDKVFAWFKSLYSPGTYKPEGRCEQSI